MVDGGVPYYNIAWQNGFEDGNLSVTHNNRQNMSFIKIIRYLPSFNAIYGDKDFDWLLHANVS